jgi:DNA-binding NtrC family response regulator
MKEQVAGAVGSAQLIGEDPIFLAMKQRLARIAQFESTVLITGETGTGKEMCARALHYLSRRAGKPFLPVNCGAIPVELFESELFGYQKGAFTSASVGFRGLIAEADGGTLFLDEIETLGLACQAKLLRFLQDHSYYSLGCSKQRQVEVWIIASTNVELPQKIQEGLFRQDLFYRLAVITLALPPLRQRVSDIPLLAAHFWKLYGKQEANFARDFSPKAIEALRYYSWPGNVRELENVIQQLIVGTDCQMIEPNDLPIPVPAIPSESRASSFSQLKRQALARFEKSYVADLIRVHNGNVTHAARAAGKERRAFGRLVKKYQIQKA